MVISHRVGSAPLFAISLRFLVDENRGKESWKLAKTTATGTQDRLAAYMILSGEKGCRNCDHDEQKPTSKIYVTPSAGQTQAGEAGTPQSTASELL